MYIVDLIEYIFTQIINNTGDINVANFSNNTIYSHPSPDGIEATFLDIFNDLKDEFCGNLALPAKSISVDHTLRLANQLEVIENKITNLLKVVTSSSLN